MPVACSPEIVRLYIELFPRPASKDRKLPVRRVLSWDRPFICFASATSINISALISMDGLRGRPPYHIVLNRFCADASFRATHASCPYPMPPAFRGWKLPVQRDLS